MEKLRKMILKIEDKEKSEQYQRRDKYNKRNVLCQGSQTIFTKYGN